MFDQIQIEAWYKFEVHLFGMFPVLHGEIKHKAGVVSVKIGGKNLSRYLRQQLLNRNVHVSSFFTVRELKEVLVTFHKLFYFNMCYLQIYIISLFLWIHLQKLCYVALDYEDEFCKDTEASYKVGYEGLFTLKQERFQTGEILFHPEIAGM